MFIFFILSDGGWEKEQPRFKSTYMAFPQLLCGTADAGTNLQVPSSVFQFNS